MVKSRMHRAGINKMRHCHLVYSPKTLIKWMRYNLIDQLIIDRDKAINRVINYFSERHFFELLKTFASLAKVNFGKGINYICDQWNKDYLIARKPLKALVKIMINEYWKNFMGR